MMNQDTYSNSKKFTEKEETDRKLTRQFHNLPQAEKTKEILAAAKAVVAIRYPEITEGDITELASLNDAISSGQDINQAKALIFLLQLSSKAILQNDKLKSDLLGFVIPQLEKHVALEGVVLSLQRPNPNSNAMARFE